MTEERPEYKTKLTGQGGPGRGQGRKKLPPELLRKPTRMKLLPRTIRQIAAIKKAHGLKYPGRVVELAIELMAQNCNDLEITEE